LIRANLPLLHPNAIDAIAGTKAAKEIERGIMH
jgi:hypothetical protein